MAVAGRVVRGLRVALVSVCLAWGAGEVGVRWLLFGEGSLPRALGEPLRDPNRFADPLTDDDFWTLQRSFQPVRDRDRFDRAHPELGWLPASVRERSLTHKGERDLKGRRPVLMYGDSFTRCVVPREDCWESLLEESHLSEELCMLNFGACAYGLDQIVLLLERSVDRYLDEDPVVVIGVLVDEDIDRCLLSFRGHPKPKVSEGPDGFSWEFPGEVSAEDWMEAHPPQVSSYLGSLFRNSELFPRSWRDEDKARTIALKQRRATWLLERARDLLRDRELEHFVVLFHSERLAMGREGTSWREAFLIRTLEELDIPFVSSRGALFQDHIVTGRVARDYYMNEGAMSGHLTAAGNQAVFPAIVEGLSRRYHRPVDIADAQASR
ncbi:MAG: hypothetical protein MK291_08285 [Planctomycetes bacterium]|nr:hypothetical protein [Planctomycetota bacterium]